ncbi:hypothetical protein SAMN04487997_0726 [Frateuria terrea]|uniref:Uncharacterized protein n=1 Tax=Frateuria terrea TaxID=529704 RepID=A0A1H6R1F9_9GAMM|nr:hypothetical protein SAMN04487997_0726 [Frateuria terrea]
MEWLPGEKPECYPIGRVGLTGDFIDGLADGRIRRQDFRRRYFSGRKSSTTTSCAGTSAMRERRRLP